ncbi:MAG: nucleotidyltransferase [Bacteroidota bacterium]
MARTIKDIQDQIIQQKESYTELDDLNSTSSTAIWRLWAYIIAVVIATSENLYDAFVENVQDLIDRLKPHTLRWYIEKILSFEYGSSLIDGDDQFDHTGLTDAEIERRKIITQAAATEENGIVVIRVAKDAPADTLQPLSSDEYNSLVSYVSRIKDAGVQVSIINVDADKTRIELDVIYDPLILSSNGNRVDGTVVLPVEKEVKRFLREIPFNSELIVAHLIDAVQGIDGVVIPTMRNIQAGKFDAQTLNTIDTSYKPFAGHMAFVESDDLIINYIANV